MQDQMLSFSIADFKKWVNYNYTAFKFHVLAFSLKRLRKIGMAFGQTVNGQTLLLPFLLLQLN